MTVLHLNNEVGAAGNRRITIYCPYWLVNLTQCALLFKQEGKHGVGVLPCGSQTNNFDLDYDETHHTGGGSSGSRTLHVGTPRSFHGYESDDSGVSGEDPSGEAHAQAAADGRNR